MHEKLERPEMLIGSTYKIKTPVSDHAMYVTINDIVLNEGTKHEQRRPFEISSLEEPRSLSMDRGAHAHHLGGVRKGGDVTFLVEELKAVFDPRGGYWQAGGKFMPSIIAELGHVIEKHLQMIGLLRNPELDEHRKKLIEDKRAEYEARRSSRTPSPRATTRRRAALSEVQHRGRGDDGRLHDVPQLWRFEVRLRPQTTIRVPHALRLEFPPATRGFWAP